ncbi:MAG: DUF3108 domain-containing protein, partial [Fidelibacterota bacterium]
MKRGSLLSALFLVVPFMATGQPWLPFQVGETLHYDSYLNLLKVGSAKLQVSALEPMNEDSVYHIIFTVRTSPLFDRIYKIRDKVETWIDSKGLFTRKFTKKVREGNYRRQFSTTINYRDSVATTTDRSVGIDHAVRDPYSLFYYLRTIPLEVGDRLSFTTFDNNRFIDFQVMVHRKETIRVPAGTFRCLVIEPFREGRSLLKNQ